MCGQEALPCSVDIEHIKQVSLLLVLQCLLAGAAALGGKAGMGSGQSNTCHCHVEPLGHCWCDGVMADKGFE